MSTNSVAIEIKNANALTYEVDVLVLKHAQALHGLDLKVEQHLSKNGKNIRAQLPTEKSCLLIDGVPIIAAKKILFVGTPPLNKFRYKKIRDFAQSALSFLKTSNEKPKELAVTVHGVGYGLDEEEAFSSQLAGFVDAITKEDCPSSLNKITFIEYNERRAKILDNLLKKTIADGVIRRDIKSFYQDIEKHSKTILSEVGYTSDNKAHVFVAMPFVEEMEDIWDYGIKPVIKSAGYVCERADLSSFTGDVMEWVKNRIESSEIVVADLTGCNANVYLEVGYAWGVGIPTILLSKDTKDLKFDVRGQRCLVYSRIKDLEKKLSAELENLKKG